MTPPKNRKRKRSKKNTSDGDYAGDVRWCLENKENLNFTAFADHFALTDKHLAYNRNMRILQKYIKAEVLKTDFKIWRKSDTAEDYWIKKTHSSTAKKNQEGTLLYTFKKPL
ncbi:hypothetical protein BD408DRAFT_424780 [Parasitella parasitica]|nr:hypothetical protein BD408DRAFT_424780 [Parasitella parasitica]